MECPSPRRSPRSFLAGRGREFLVVVSRRARRAMSASGISHPASLTRGMKPRRDRRVLCIWFLVRLRHALCLGFHLRSGVGAAGFSRFQTDKVRPSPGLLVKSAGRSSPGLAKHDRNVSPSTSYIPSCFLPLVNPSVIW